MKRSLHRVVGVVVCVLAPFAGCRCDVGGVVADSTSRKDVDGDDNSSVNVDDVAVDEANVDIDSDVDSDIESDVEVNNDVDIVFGEEDEEEEEEEEGNVAVGAGVAFSNVYAGGIGERSELTPHIDDALAVSSIEWLVFDAVFDAPTLVDDEEWFDWGDAGADGSYVVSAAFDDDSDDTFVWTKSTRFCDGACHARSISALCSARLVLRVWLDDGSFVDATGEHRSARITCP